MSYVAEINCERTISEHVLRYGGTLLKSDFYLVDGFSKSDNRYKPLLKLPKGTHKLEFEDSIIEVEYGLDIDCLKNSGNKVEHIFVRSNDSLDHIYNFLEQSRINSLNYKSDKVTCRVMKKGYWSELSSLPKRKLDSVILDKDNLTNIVTDIHKFIDSEDEYLDKGIPYKRNYLLEGLPGTGKTSLIFAIASELDMDLCVINFSHSVDDINFMDAISNMNDKSILVLEDIDCVFGDRKSEITKSGITFAGILNVLDGIGRKHKLITFMTTNYSDRLDNALIRPGRIDYKLKFEFSNKEQTKQMYHKLINNANDGDCKTFIDKVKKYKYTTATLQKYLFKYRDANIQNIMDNIEDEFTDMCEDKKDAPGNLYI